MSWWACGAQQRVALSHYHVGGAAFVPVLGDAHHGVVDKVEVVVTLRESIMLFCGQCPNHVLRASSVNMHDCGQNVCAMQLRLRALHCAVAHAVNAAGVKHEVATISVDDIERNSILPYATAHKHTGKGDVTLVKMTVSLKSSVPLKVAAHISESLSSLTSLDTPAECGAHVDEAYATRNAFEDPTGWKLPAAVVAARVACGNGVVGRSCAYICPASWTKSSVVPIDVFSMYAGGHGVDGVDGGEAVSDGIQKGKSNIETSFIGIVSQTEREDEEQAQGEIPDCPEGTTLDEAEQLARDGQPCVMKPKVRHEEYQVFAFVGLAEEEKHAALRGDLDGCSLYCRGTVAKMNIACEKWAHHKSDAEAHAECTQEFNEVSRICEIDRATCDDDPTIPGPKGSRTKVPGSPVEVSCEPCGHFMYYHLHDIAGMGANSKFETHLNADAHNDLFEKPIALPELHASFSKPHAFNEVPSSLGTAAMLLEGVESEPDVVAAAAAQFGSSVGACSVMFNAFCAHECNQAVQSALDSCVEWSGTLHTEDYATSSSAAERCIRREQAAKGVCKASSTKCVEPVMRGFYAAGLRKNAVPRKAQLTGKGMDNRAVAAAGAEQDTVVVPQSAEPATRLGASEGVARGGIPAHIRSTAHRVPSESANKEGIAWSSDDGFSQIPFEFTTSVPNGVKYFAAAVAAAAMVAMVVYSRRASGAAGVPPPANARTGERTPLLRSTEPQRTYRAV
jgi:hypothetical protein